MMTVPDFMCNVVDALWDSRTLTDEVKDYDLEFRVHERMIIVRFAHEKEDGYLSFTHAQSLRELESIKVVDVLITPIIQKIVKTLREKSSNACPSLG